MSTTVALVLAVVADLSKPLRGKEKGANSLEGEISRNAAVPEQVVADESGAPRL